MKNAQFEYGGTVEAMSLETQKMRDEINIRLEQLKESLTDPEMDERKTGLIRGEIVGLQSVLLILDRDVPDEVSGAEGSVAMSTDDDEEPAVQTDDTEPIAEETDQEQFEDPEGDASQNSIDDEESSADTPTPAPETDDTPEGGRACRAL